MYALWFNFLALFTARRCRVSLSNGTVITWLRPKDISKADYRAAFDGWRAVADNRIKLDSGKVAAVISSRDVVSVEIR